MGNKPGQGRSDSEKGTVIEEVAFYQEFSVPFRVSISEKRTEWKVRLILKSNRETVKDGMMLRNKSQQMTEECQDRK